MDPNLRSQWLLNWIDNEIQNRHDETGIKRTFNDVVKVIQINIVKFSIHFSHWLTDGQLRSRTFSFHSSRPRKTYRCPQRFIFWSWFLPSKFVASNYLSSWNRCRTLSQTFLSSSWKPCFQLEVLITNFTKVHRLFQLPYTLTHSSRNRNTQKIFYFCFSVVSVSHVGRDLQKERETYQSSGTKWGAAIAARVGQEILSGAVC